MMAASANDLPARRIPALDGLRAVSIALVLVGHLGGTRNFASLPGIEIAGDVANLGVTIFFVISGFLITSLLLKEESQTGTVSLRSFYARRAFRILPALGLYLSVIALAAVITAAIRIPSADWLHAVTFTMNYHQQRGWWLGHLWSLSVEEQFYFLWPAAIVLLGRTRSFRLAALAVGFAPLWRVAAWWLWPDGRAAIGETFPTVVDAIAVGCLLAAGAEWLAGRPGYRRFLASPTFVAVPALVLICNALDRYPSFYFTAGMTFRNLGIAAIVHWAILGSNRTATAWLDAPVVRFIGRASYSLYLWQQPFLNRHSVGLVAAFPLNITCAFACAVASFAFIETPALRLRERIGLDGGRVPASAHHTTSTTVLSAT
ncbi:MAG TPA: acyltransferase [Vicinamibacterales bacterium]|jgi:peptidoglycan/LPS O-acetylase OafA/YrhL